MGGKESIMIDMFIQLEYLNNYQVKNLKMKGIGSNFPVAIK